MEYASYACNTEYHNTVHEWQVYPSFNFDNDSYVLLLHGYYIQELLHNILSSYYEVNP